MDGSASRKPWWRVLPSHLQCWKLLLSHFECAPSFAIGIQHLFSRKETRASRSKHGCHLENEGSHSFNFFRAIRSGTMNNIRRPPNASPRYRLHRTLTHPTSAARLPVFSADYTD